MLSAVRLLWAANNVGWANHTCITHFTYVFTMPYELDSLILMLSYIYTITFINNFPLCLSYIYYKEID